MMSACYIVLFCVTNKTEIVCAIRVFLGVLAKSTTRDTIIIQTLENPSGAKIAINSYCCYKLLSVIALVRFDTDRY